MRAEPAPGHDRLHVGEVEVDQPRRGDQVGDARDALQQHLVGRPERVQHRDGAVGDRQQPVVRDDDERVDLVAQLVDADLGGVGPPAALEAERPGHHADGERAERAGDAGHDRRAAGAGAAALARGDEDHVGPLEDLLDLLGVVLGGLPADLGVGAGAEAPGQLAADVELDVGVAHQQRLRVGVDRDELDALEADLDHPVDGVDAAAADADDLDDREVVLRCCHVGCLSLDCSAGLTTPEVPEPSPSSRALIVMSTTRLRQDVGAGPGRVQRPTRRHAVPTCPAVSRRSPGRLRAVALVTPCYLTGGRRVRGAHVVHVGLAGDAGRAGPRPCAAGPVRRSPSARCGPWAAAARRPRHWPAAPARTDPRTRSAGSALDHGQRRRAAAGDPASTGTLDHAAARVGRSRRPRRTPRPCRSTRTYAVPRASTAAGTRSWTRIVDGARPVAATTSTAATSGSRRSRSATDPVSSARQRRARPGSRPTERTCAAVEPVGAVDPHVLDAEQAGDPAASQPASRRQRSAPRRPSSVTASRRRRRRARPAGGQPAVDLGGHGHAATRLQPGQHLAGRSS